MRKSTTERYTGLSLCGVAFSLAGNRAIYITLGGNSEAYTGTRKGALALAKYLHKTAKKVEEWSRELR